MAHLRQSLWMVVFLCFVVFSAVARAQQSTDGQQVTLEPGDHVRKLEVDQRQRTYLVHVPHDLKADQPIPVVLALHGALMNGPMMVWFSGLSEKADEAGFIVVYPSGAGRSPFLTWNAGGTPSQWQKNSADDVVFINALLDDLATVANVDAKRVFACGMSNGGMMCYRLAAELSPRIAAIASVAGAVAIEESNPSRAVPVLHIHGKEDKVVPFEKPRFGGLSLLKFQSVEESIQTWVKLNDCNPDPTVDILTKPEDRLQATRKTYAGGQDGSEVVLIEIAGAGHTWPGKPSPLKVLGKSALNVSANDLMWEFFERHPLESIENDAAE